MKRTIISILLCLILSSMVLAAPPSTTIVQSSELIISSNIPNSIKQNVTRTWDIHILNSSKIIESGVTCNLHIYEEYSSGGHSYKNSSSVFSTDHDIEFTIPNTAHLNKGVYSYKIYCNTSNQAGIYERAYYVTKGGLDPAGDNLTLFIYALFIVGVLSLFYTFFIGIAKLVTAQETVYGVLLSWGSLILMILVYFMAQEYLLRTFVEDLTSNLITLTIWTNGVLPLLSLIITFFIKSTQKKKLPSPIELGGFKFG